MIAEGIGSNALAINPKGEIYFTEPETRRISFIDAKGSKRVVHEGITLSNGLRLFARSFSAPGSPYQVAGICVLSNVVQASACAGL